MPRLTKADISGPSNFQHVSGTDRSGHTFGLETYNDQEPKTETKENEKPSSPNKTPVSRKKLIKLFQNKKGQKNFQVPAVKKDPENGAPGNFFGPSHFVTVLVQP